MPHLNWGKAFTVKIVERWFPFEYVEGITPEHGAETVKVFGICGAVSGEPEGRTGSEERFGHIARGIVIGREQNPLETVFGPVRWVAIPNDGQGQDPRFCGNADIRRRTRR